MCVYVCAAAPAGNKKIKKHKKTAGAADRVQSFSEGQKIKNKKLE
jgi:hypothetical protein